MLLADSVEPIRFLGYTLGNFATPGAALLSAFALGWMMGAIPTGAAEPLVLAIAMISVPPYHLAVIGAGLVRTPLWLFLLASFVGRATRFLAVASLPWVAEVLFG